jgi:hypothetical protein
LPFSTRAGESHSVSRLHFTQPPTLFGDLDMRVEHIEAVIADPDGNTVEITV